MSGVEFLSLYGLAKGSNLVGCVISDIITSEPSITDHGHGPSYMFPIALIFENTNYQNSHNHLRELLEFLGSHPGHKLLANDLFYTYTMEIKDFKKLDGEKIIEVILRGKLVPLEKYNF